MILLRKILSVSEDVDTEDSDDTVTETEEAMMK